ncbi:Adenylate cyclase, class 3 [Shimia gijangensis]|uniref:Adenylate cyclase, class 3 n=1 Tax=Shimia gijangensis TaxID=1470563 RepID=A0A1M6NBT3_9RHOB|nr:GAF domain-containing protein [Shimia gijangensis]SHJ93117.1 Adenylate cyclase, class 3 [Shimia gijangensis]
MEKDSKRENLLVELRRGLQREEATRSILGVIQNSRDDEGPVFEAILTQAAELCAASQASLQLANAARTQFEIASYWGFEETAFNVGGSAPLDSGRPIPEVIRTGRTINTTDLKNTAFYVKKDPVIKHVVDVEGVRSWLIVPLLNGPQAIGAIALSRKVVSPFSDDEIALVETFAAQAVIAIENVRQFRELQTRLAHEVATSEILGVISRSREDEKPVFEAILDNAQALCNAPMSALVLARANDDHQILASHRGLFPKAVELFEGGQMVLDATVSYAAKSIIEERLIDLPDMGESELYKAGSPVVRSMVDDSKIRSVLFVPLILNGEAIGTITLFRQQVQPFSPQEVALVQTFAAQAVIAIENVRQFRALESLNAGLEDRVEAQVGEIERMGRLKRFLPSAVADAIVQTGSDELLSSHRVLLGVVFCDIRGFTSFCETAEPEETIEILQTYHEEMGKLINAHGAGVDHRMGDGIMVLFNDPLPCDDPAGSAVGLAIAMRAKMAELSQQWKRLGYRLGFGVGVSLGYATVGMVGYEGRFEYTASGTAINLASRLCDEAKDGEILLSPRAAIAVESDLRVEARGELVLKGMREPVETFRLSDVGSD